MPFEFQIQPPQNALQQIAAIDQIEGNRLMRDQFIQGQKDRAAIKAVAPRALDGDKAALSEIAGINPELAFKFSDAFNKLDKGRRDRVEAGVEVAARVAQMARAAKTPEEARRIWDEGFTQAAKDIDPAMAGEVGKFDPQRADYTVKRSLAIKDVIDWTMRNNSADVQAVDPTNPAAGTRLNAQKIRFAGAESGARTSASEGARYAADKRRADFDVNQERAKAAARGWGSADAPHMAGDNVVIPSQVVAGQRAAQPAPGPSGTIDMQGVGAPQGQQQPGVYPTGNNTKQIGNANQLRDEFNKLTTDFRTVQDAHAKIRSAAASSTGAGDMAMLYAYVKLLDPGSVVRESEFATAAASGSFGERIQGMVQRILTGERMPDSLRRDFLREADNIYKTQQAGYDRTVKNYEGFAGRLGVPKEMVIGDWNRNTAGTPATVAPTAVPPPPAGFTVVP